jgi:hypothetical protein
VRIRTSRLSCRCDEDGGDQSSLDGRLARQAVPGAHELAASRLRPVQRGSAHGLHNANHTQDAEIANDGSDDRRA